MAAPATPPRKSPVRPKSTTPAPPPPRGPGAGSALVTLLLVAAVGAAGWFVYGEYQKRAVVEAVAPEPEKPVATETIPDPEVLAKSEKKPVEVAEKKPEEVEKTPGVPKPEPLAPLPLLNLPEALPALRAATLERMKDGRWADHAKTLETAVVATIEKRSRTGGGAIIDSLCTTTALPLALAQIDLIDRMGADDFAAFAKTGDEFATRVITTSKLAELFANNLAAEDRPTDALRVWKLLDAAESTPADKEHYRNLALALALIHDRPGDDEKVSEIYSYYRESDKNHKLYVDFEKIRPDELVWGVGPHSFSLDDQRWALKNLNYPLAKLGEAYPSIPYRINHAPYPAYTMVNVLHIGGICMNQSQYAEANARARGVPAAYISGEGSRGGHAWFAFRGAKGWTNTTGRYADGYACGHARNPQTGNSMREWDLFLYNDPARANGDLDAALRLARAGKVAARAGNADANLDLVTAAVERDKRNPMFWRLRFDALLATDKGQHFTDYWKELAEECRAALRANPDFHDIADNLEEKKVLPKMRPDNITDMLAKRRKQTVKGTAERFDLLTEAIRREAAYYHSIKDDARVGTLYNSSLREYGKNLPTFVRLTEDFAKLAEDIPSIRKAGLSTMESVFNKEVDSKLKGDTFALKMQSDVAAKVSKIFEDDGDTAKAKKYADRAKIIGDKAAAERAAMQ